MATADGACDTAHAKVVRDPGQRYVVGHALWHFEHPELPCPCIAPSKILDVESAVIEKLRGRADR